MSQHLSRRSHFVCTLRNAGDISLGVWSGRDGFPNSGTTENSPHLVLRMLNAIALVPIFAGFATDLISVEYTGHLVEVEKLFWKYFILFQKYFIKGMVMQ